MAHESRWSERQMSPFDALLYRGDADPATRSMLVAAGVLDRAPRRSEFLAAVDRASRIAVRLRQCVVSAPVPVVLPEWTVDPDFDLAYHVRFLHIDPPGTLEQLLGIVQVEALRPLDPARPLWEIVLVEGLEHDRAAVLIRMSHAISDGIGSVRLFSALFDPRRSIDHGPMPPAPIPEDRSPDDVIADSLRRWPRSAMRSAWRTAADAWTRGRHRVGTPVVALADVKTYLDSVKRVLVPDATPSAVLAGRSLKRRCLAFDIPIALMKRAGRQHDASLNDVYLAGLVGAIRRYHLALGVEPVRIPIAIPVNLRDANDTEAGNRFGVIVLAAPLDVSEPARRLEILKDQVRSGRAEPAIAAPAVFAPMLARLPDWLRSHIAALMPRPDIQASNVPGSPTPVYLAGCRVERLYAFGPVPGVAAMFALQSLAATCHVGMNADTAAITEFETLAACLHDGFAEVLPATGRGRGLATPMIGLRLPDESRR